MEFDNKILQNVFKIISNRKSFYYDGFIGFGHQAALIYLIFDLRKRRYSVKDLPIESRVLNHWKEENILLENQIEKNKWGKFNLIDLIWINIIKELRDFGISIPLIKSIKNDIIDCFANQRDYNKIKIPESYIEKFDNDDDKEEFKEYIYSINIAENLAAHVIRCILSKQNISIVVFNNNDCFFWNEQENKLRKNISDEGISDESLRYKSHLKISITDIIKNYLLKEKDLLNIQNDQILSTNEKEVIEYIRKGKINELKIIFNDNKISRIEIKDSKTTDIESRLLDHIIKGGYHSITYKTVDGKLVSFERITQIKLKK